MYGSAHHGISLKIQDSLFPFLLQEREEETARFFEEIKYLSQRRVIQIYFSRE